ncbi:MAG: phosphatase PAP2 family protein [Verrucomicrobiales bacterium]|nr:phosphatase PAP2 family protein [Verrucomicrobiales bacterium]
MPMHLPLLFNSRRIWCGIAAAVLTGLAGRLFAADPIVLPAGVDFSILPAPPADHSPAGLADLSVLLYVQADRTKEQEKLAKEMASPSVFAMGREIFGDWFRRENLPKTAEILRQTTKATDPVLQAAKKHWKRPRPYQRSEKISPVVGKPGDAGSYPSGHTFGIAVPEFVLSAAFPEHAEALDARIHRVMWGRVVGGVHYPTDTEAGRLLAKHVVEKLLETPAMRDAIKTIREEAAPFLAKAARVPAAAGRK